MTDLIDGTTFYPLHRPWVPQCTASQTDGWQYQAKSAHT